MYAYVLFSIADQSYTSEIEAFPSIASKLLPDTYNPVPLRYNFDNKFVLFAWYQNQDPEGVRARINPGLSHHPAKGYFFTSGYAAEGMVDEKPRFLASRMLDTQWPRPSRGKGIFDLIAVSSDGIRLKDSPGGIGACVWVSPDNSRSVCWSTQPSAIPTFFAKNRSGYCVVGNRPRLVHGASILSHGHKLDREYVSKYLVSGFALDGKTPYRNTVALPFSRSLEVEQSNYKIAPYLLDLPAETPQTTPLSKKADKLATLLSEAMWPATVMPESQLFLSGGKDSRTLACVLKSIAPNRVNAFTLGSIERGEGKVAAPVAKRFAKRFSTRTQAIIADPIKAAIVSNNSTDGLGINFAHQYNFRQDLSDLRGLPTYHGHSHLLRGGFARTMNGDKQTLRNSLRGSFLSPFVKEGAKSWGDQFLTDWENERAKAFRDGRDILFYGQQDFRLALFTAPSSMDLTARTFMLYPLMDERVARFAASLSVFDRVSERVVFGAMQKLAKELTDLPLMGEIWRFDKYPEKRDFVDSDHNFQEGYALRQPEAPNKLAELNADLAQFIYDADNNEPLDRRRIMASTVLDSSMRTEIAGIVAPEVMDEFNSVAATGRSTDYLNGLDVNTRFNMRSFMNRVFIAATLYDLSW